MGSHGTKGRYKQGCRCRACRDAYSAYKRAWRARGGAAVERERAASRAWKERNAGVCEACGQPTNACRGLGTAAKMCQECHEWPDEAIVAAIQEWAADHGGIPPIMDDWRPAPTGYPSAYTVNRRLGWNAALLRAGLELHKDRRPETQAEIERLIRRGVSVREIADRFGCTAGNIYLRLRIRGLRVSDLRPAA